jgi:uncharacterized membrane protein
MRLISCVQQFLDLYHFRIKGSSQRTIKAYREALALFLPFAAKYYSIKVASLSIDHLSLQLFGLSAVRSQQCSQYQKSTFSRYQIPG